MTPTGSEHPSKTPTKTPIPKSGGAESGAPGAPERLRDPELQRIIDAWDGLPEAVRAGIVAMVNAAGGAGE